MDNHVQMEEHINQIRKSAFYYLNWIKKIRPYLTQEFAKSVVHALGISKIDYCNSLFVNLPNKLLCRLQYILHCAARLITGTPKHEHITPSLVALHWLPVRKRIEFKVLLLTYNALCGQGPQYIQDMLVPYAPSRTIRTRGYKPLQVPRMKTKYGERAFSYAAPSLWNALPDFVKSAKNVKTFKKLLKTYLFQKEYSTYL